MIRIALFSRRKMLGTLGCLGLGLLVGAFFSTPWAGAQGEPGEEVVMNLPQPQFDGKMSLEKAIRDRRTVRAFAPDPLALEHLSQLLWAAQGITDPGGYKRAAPSAGALYPMDVYAVAGEGSVAGLEAGIYHYQPKDHSLRRLSGGDARDSLARASLGQRWMAQAPVNLVITAEYARISGKYGDRGVRYAMIEAGHVGQNIFLQAEACGLSAGIVGAFHDREVIQAMKTPSAHEPLLIMPVGRKK